MRIKNKKIFLIALIAICNACYGQFPKWSHYFDTITIGSIRIGDPRPLNIYTNKSTGVERARFDSNGKVIFDSIYNPPLKFKKSIHWDESESGPIDTSGLHIVSSMVNKLFDSVTIGGNEEPVYHRRKDTVSVILLITDTTVTGLYYSWADNKSHEYYDMSSIKGYSVRELHNTGEGANPIFGEELFDDYWQHIEYLDAQKKPLSKNIIVWQSKEQ